MRNIFIDAHSQIFRSVLVLNSVLSLCLIVGCSEEGAQGEDEHLGLVEYEVACMPCHGIDGRGDGPKAQQLAVQPADLTQISKANGGKFPFEKVAQIIDGRATVIAHRAREMPVWGDRYSVAIETDENPGDIEQRAQHHITALVRYLESIQRP